MIRRYGKRIVIEFYSDIQGFEEILRRLRERRIICEMEIMEICRQKFKTDAEPCFHAIKSLLGLSKYEINNEDLGDLLRGIVSKKVLLSLLNCGKPSRKDALTADNMVKALNYYLLREAIKGVKKADIKLGNINSSAVKRALYITKKYHVPVKITSDNDHIIIEMTIDEESARDKLSGKYRSAPTIIADILSLSDSWQAEIELTDGAYLKLRSNSYWIKDFKPPWFLLNENPPFDSTVEKIVFEALRELNLTVLREPEVIILDREVFIPDFAVKLGNKKLFIEVVGFWTEDYLKKKVRKLSKFNKDIILIVDSRLELDVENLKIITYSYPPKKERLVRALRGALEIES